MSRDDKGSHEDDRNDQRCQPIFLTNFQEVPDVFDEIKKCFHGSKDASEVSSMVLAVFSISYLPFSPSSQWVISSEAHEVSDGLKNNDEYKTQDDVTINPSKSVS